MRARFRELATSSLLFHNLLAAAREQTTVYDAGTSLWVSEGHVAAVPLSGLRAFCSSPSALPIGDDLQAYILSSSQDAVSLRFNGSAVAVFGITFAYNTCDDGKNPTLASLEVAPAPPPPPDGGGDPEDPVPAPDPVCDDYPAPVADCNVLLAQWTGLDSTDRHRVFISTTGAKIAVLSARVTEEANESDGPLNVPATPTLMLPTTTLLATSEASPFSKTPPTSVSLFSSPQGATSVSESAPLASATASGQAGYGTHLGRSSQRDRVIAAAVLGCAAALAAVCGVLYTLHRRRQRRRISPHRVFLPGAMIHPRRSQKQRKMKMLFPEDLPALITSASSSEEHGDSLSRAANAAGLTTEELLASLNRLRDQAAAGQLSGPLRPVTLSPPSYQA